MIKLFQFNKDFYFSIFIIIFFYILSLTFFYFNVDPNGGAYLDYLNQKRISKQFAIDFYYNFINFDKESTRHSPLLLIILSIFEKFNLSDNTIRLFFFHFCFVLPFIFFKILDFEYSEVSKEKKILLSLIILLSPTYISLSIWPDSRIYGVIFFTLAIYYFLKFSRERNNLNLYLCILSYTISSYFSLNFVLLSFYFIVKFIVIFKDNKIKLLKLFFLNTILAFPAIFYTLSLETIFFFKSGIGGKSFDLLQSLNFSNKFLLISSIIYFYFIPFFLANISKVKLFEIKNFIISCLIVVITYSFFSYKPEYSGGGIFFQLSNFILKNNFIFIITCIFSITFLLNLIYKNFFNILIVLLLIISNIQLSIYHKYYDPLLFILFFTILDIKIIKKSLKKIKLRYFYIFYILFLFLNLIKKII